MRAFPFRRFLVVNSKPELDTRLLRYAGMLASCAENPEIVLAASGGERLLGNIAPVARTALRMNAPGTLSYRVMLQPDLQLLFDIARECKTDLIVTHHPRESDHARPVLRQLLFDSPCAVCLVPEGAALSLQRMIARVEPTPRGHQLLSIAAAVARAVNSEELIAVHSHFRYSLDWDPGSLETMRAHRQLEMYRFMSRADVMGVNCTPVLQETPRQAEALLRLIDEHRVDLAVIDPTVDEAPEWQWNRRTSEGLAMSSPVPSLSVRLSESGMLAGLKERLFCEMEPLFN